MCILPDLTAGQAFKEATRPAALPSNHAAAHTLTRTRTHTHTHTDLKSGVTLFKATVYQGCQLPSEGAVGSHE